MRLRRSFTANRKASSEENCVHTHISFRNVVQIHLWIFRNCVCVFRSCVCTAKHHSNGNGFHKCTPYCKYKLSSATEVDTARDGLTLMSTAVHMTSTLVKGTAPFAE